MAFTVTDARDLIRLLAEHPEWRAELRPLILGDEFLAVPARIAAIDERIAEMDQRLTANIERLSANVERLSGNVDRQSLSINRLDGRVGNLDGDRLEERYARHARDWFSPFVRFPTLIGVADLREVLSRRDEGSLAPAEYRRLIDTDILIRGLDASDEAVIWAAEIAGRIHLDDVARADVSVRILRESGYTAHGLVAGHEIDEEAQLSADALGISVDLRRR